MEQSLHIPDLSTQLFHYATRLYIFRTLNKFIESHFHKIKFCFFCHLTLPPFSFSLLHSADSYAADREFLHTFCE